MNTEINLTELETKMLNAFIQEGYDAMDGETIEDLRDDNMTWCNSQDLILCLEWDGHQVAGVMSSLEKKGIIINSEESPRGATQPDWFVSDLGLDIAEKAEEAKASPAPVEEKDVLRIGKKMITIDLDDSGAPALNPEPAPEFKNMSVGFYTPTKEFKAIPEMTSIMYNDFSLIAVTGPARDRESVRIAALYSAAPEMLEALESFLSAKTLATKSAAREKAEKAIRKARMTFVIKFNDEN